MTGGPEPLRRAGHESDPDYVDKDLAGRDVRGTGTGGQGHLDPGSSSRRVGDSPGVGGDDLLPGVEREGEYVDVDVDPSLPHASREGDYTDVDVPDDDGDTPPGSYVRSDGSGPDR